MVPNKKSFLFALCAILPLLTACQSPAPQQRLPEMSFADQTPMRLDVARLDVVSDYRSPAREPYIEHLMPVSPAGAITRWTQDRIQPIGREGYARLVIREASVKETVLKTDRGVSGLFKEQQEIRYDAALDVVLQILDDRRLPLAEVQARATRSRTAPEGITLNERERLWYDMVKQLTEETGTQLESSAKNYLNRWMTR